MSFRDFVLSQNISTSVTDFVQSISSIEDIMKKDEIEIKSMIPNLSALFNTYLITGGFPRAIHSYNISGKINDEIIADICDLLSKDILRLDKAEDIAKNVMRSVINKIGTPVSWNTIAKDIGISQPTARDYIETFEKCS